VGKSSSLPIVGSGGRGCAGADEGRYNEIGVPRKGEGAPVRCGRRGRRKQRVRMQADGGRRGGKFGEGGGEVREVSWRRRLLRRRGHVGERKGEEGERGGGGGRARMPMWT
jgi:hypothetical protein